VSYPSGQQSSVAWDPEALQQSLDPDYAVLILGTAQKRHGFFGAKVFESFSDAEART